MKNGDGSSAAVRAGFAAALACVVMMCGYWDYPPRSITVTSPNGGETYYCPGPVEITWTSEGVTGEVDILFSLDGGGEWALVERHVENTGEYEWKLPRIESSECLVRVEWAEHEPSGTSEGTFTIAKPAPGPFVDSGVTLTGVSNAEAEWGDYDADGDLDIAMIGAVDVGMYICKIYRNDGGSFEEVPAGLPAGYYSSLAWGDYDGDGDLDLVVCGNAGGSSIYSKIYRNDGADGFTDTLAVLKDLFCADTAWGDYDNDGDLDLAISGDTVVGVEKDLHTLVYENEGGYFTNSGAGLDGVKHGCLAWGDYDNDGDLDLAVTGAPESGGLTRIYRNSGGSFSPAAVSIPDAFTSPALAWGDYDGDGDLDLALSGNIPSSGKNTGVFRNTGGSFSDAGAGLTDTMRGSVAWGDCDNDGSLDLAVAGVADSGCVLKVYCMDGGSLVNSGEALTGLGDSSLAWGDYDNDGDLDLLVTGATAPFGERQMLAILYRNDCPRANLRPSPPGGLDAEVRSGEVTLSWGEATDFESPAPALTYNLRVGTAPGQEDVMPGMSLIGGQNDGLRLVPAMGNVQHNTSWTLDGLAPGTYYWSVQAVDTAFAGSPWAAERSFTIE